jgi:hypothetical protein
MREAKNLCLWQNKIEKVVDDGLQGCDAVWTWSWITIFL